MSGGAPGPDDDVVAEAARSNLKLTPLIAFVGFLSTVLVVRLLAPDEFALYAVALALRGTFQWLSDMGMGAASSRVFAEMRARGVRGQALRLYRRLFAIRAGISAVFVVLVVSLQHQATELLGLRADEGFFLVAVVPIAVAEMTAGLGFYVLSGTFGQRVINAVVLAQGVIQTVLVVVAAVAGLGLPGILGAVVAGSVLKALMLNVAALRAVRALSDEGEYLTGLRVTYAAVGSASALGKVAAWAHSKPAITLLVAAAFGRDEVALFTVAYDLVHQLLNLTAAPLYSLLLPLFATRRQSPTASAELLRSTSRALGLIVLPVAAVLIAVYPSLSDLLFGSFYRDSFTYAAIIAAGFAVEILLSGPATSLIFAHEHVIRSYLGIKAVTLAAAVLYLPLAATSVVAVTSVMMGVRVLSAVAMHVVAWRRLGARIDLAWTVRLGVAAAIAAMLGAAAAASTPGAILDVVVASTVTGATILAAIRLLRLFRPEEAALARRVVPRTERAIRVLSPK